jgi:hypothetical protein
MAELTRRRDFISSFRLHPSSLRFSRSRPTIFWAARSGKTDDRIFDWYF